MATIEAQARTGSAPYEVLSEEQIEQLLLEAETRLRQKAGLAVTQSSNTESRIVIPKLQHGIETSTYIKERNGIAHANPDLLASKEQKEMADGLRSVQTSLKAKKANDETDAGDQWFNLPKTTLTPQLKRDLQLIEMRSVLDPHRHYKKNIRKGKVPTFSQVGTVIEGPTEWYSGRINKKDRSKTFVEETMKSETASGRFKRKYGEIQDAKMSGKKAHYKKLLQKRQNKR